VFSSSATNAFSTPTIFHITCQGADTSFHRQQAHKIYKSFLLNALQRQPPPPNNRSNLSSSTPSNNNHSISINQYTTMKISISQATRVINKASSAPLSTSSVARTFSSQECFSFYPTKRNPRMSKPQQLNSMNRECFSYYPSTNGKSGLTAAATSIPAPTVSSVQHKPVNRQARYNNDVASQRWVADVAMQFFSNNNSSTKRASAREYHNESSN
jgi:hypothetical protein